MTYPTFLVCVQGLGVNKLVVVWDNDYAVGW